MRRKRGGLFRFFAQVLLAAVLAMGLSWLPFEFVGRHGLMQYFGLKSELRTIKERNRRKAAEIRVLTRQVEDLRSNDAAISRVARDELGLIRDGEIVFVVRQGRWR
ncbi:MAG: septum formation initiator family protein [Deltaproteobacteria bacterium]|nr:septum formation initiator family protein [Deltaproteobacteria bacterium]